MPPESTDTLEVFSCIAPTIVANYEAIMADALFDMKKPVEEGKLFNISRTSGYIRYSNHDGLWKNPSPIGKDKDATTARKKAETFIRLANSKIGSHGKVLAKDRFKLAVFPTSLPLDFQHIWTRAVFTEGYGYSFHWLCQFNITIHQLRTMKIRGDQFKADVQVPIEGAFLEMRIGAGEEPFGKNSYVLGLNLRMRVCNHSIRTATDLFPPPKSLQANEKGMYPVHYAIFGDNDSQRFISPFYYVPIPGKFGMIRVPASRYSLMVDIIASYGDEKGKLKLTAIILNEEMMFQNKGGRNLIFNWAIFRLDELPHSFTEKRGRTKEVELVEGVYNVALVVEDKDTMATASTQCVVSAGIVPEHGAVG